MALLPLTPQAIAIALPRTDAHQYVADAPVVGHSALAIAASTVVKSSLMPAPYHSPPAPPCPTSGRGCNLSHNGRRRTRNRADSRRGAASARAADSGGRHGGKQDQGGPVSSALIGPRGASGHAAPRPLHGSNSTAYRRTVRVARSPAIPGSSLPPIGRGQRRSGTDPGGPTSRVAAPGSARWADSRASR